MINSKENLFYLTKDGEKLEIVENALLRHYNILPISLAACGLSSFEAKENPSIDPIRLSRQQALIASAKLNAPVLADVSSITRCRLPDQEDPEYVIVCSYTLCTSRDSIESFAVISFGNASCRDSLSNLVSETMEDQGELELSEILRNLSASTSDGDCFESSADGSRWVHADAFSNNGWESLLSCTSDATIVSHLSTLLENEKNSSAAVTISSLQFSAYKDEGVRTTSHSIRKQCLALLQNFLDLTTKNRPNGSLASYCDSNGLSRSTSNGCSNVTTPFTSNDTSKAGSLASSCVHSTANSRGISKVQSIGHNLSGLSDIENFNIDMKRDIFPVSHAQCETYCKEAKSFASPSDLAIVSGNPSDQHWAWH